MAVLPTKGEAEAEGLADFLQPKSQELLSMRLRNQQFIRKSYRFAKDADRARALGRFEEGRRVFGKVATEG
jgi:hypothetical protein